jgi:hypothetical protein
VIDAGQVRAALALPDSVITDEDLSDVLEAVRITQASVVEYPPAGTDTPDLDRALIRRVAREIAARGLPLGAQTTEYGTSYVPRHDPILNALEAPYLRGPFA